MKPEYGMVHGRFQPFHNGHLEYACHALARCQKLVVGITNPDPSAIEKETASTHRHLSESNPYTFFQRLLMVVGSLLDEGVEPARLLVIPFHISSPDRWEYYLPPRDRMVHYLRVFSPWEQAKVERIRQAGYRVEVLDPGIEKGIEATEVRRRMTSGDESWRKLVPRATAHVIDAIEAARRSETG